jgi:hypothetical protein
MMTVAITRTILSILFVVLALPALAQDKPLPKVLVVGDSIYYQHARGVTADLKDRAEVTVVRAYDYGVLNSQTILEHLDEILGRVDRNGNPVPEEKWPKWDVIHFNVGLGDLIHRVPGMKDFRVLPIDAGGVVATDRKQYEKNLEVLVRRLKAAAPDAKLVWASTTPIRHSRSNVFKMGSEIEYNAIAAKVMARHGLATIDMYTYVKHLIAMDKPAGHGADPFNFDRKPIHMPIVRVIEQAFGFEPMAETEEEKAVQEAMVKPAPVQG